MGNNSFLCFGTKKKHGKRHLTTSDLIGQNKGNIYDFYQMIRQLGSGSFGQVFEVNHKKTNIKRAVKIINIQNLSQSEIKQLKEQIQILRSMDHPNVMKIIEYFQDSKYNLYLISQLYSGGQLFNKIIQNNYFDQNTAAIIIKQILQAVNYLHQKNVVHRDIKPQNILFQSSDFNSIKICDFGTALFLQKHKRLNQFIGTVFYHNQAYYVAPEVLARNYNFKCDIWSCGVILYILLSGRPPFDGKNDNQIMQKVKIGNYNLQHAPFKYVSAQAKELISMMLEKNVEKRLTALECLRHKWFDKAKNLTQPRDLFESLQNLKKFRNISKFQQASLMYLIHYNLNKEQKTKLSNHFKSLDKNKDGKLSREQLKDGLKQIYGQLKAQQMVKSTFSQYDLNNTGYLDYSEFLMAATKKQKILNDNLLMQTFKMIDIDGNGYISKDEIKQMFSGNNQINYNQILDMIKQADKNRDNRISFNQFKDIMIKLK